MMASLQFIFLILATVCMTVQAKNNQSACNQANNQSASGESVTLVKELESEAVEEIMSTANELTSNAMSTVMSLVKSEQARMAKVKAAMAGVKADLTSEMTIKAIVRELKAELTRDHSMAVSELKEMLNTQKEIIKNQAADMKALREGLSYRLENSERKIEWAITDGSLAPRNTSWVMESLSRIEKRLDDIDHQLNQTREDLGFVREMNPLYHDCSEIYHGGNRTSGVYTIYPQGGAGLKVYCDMETDGGGWTVFQKRYSGEVDFFRGWEQYAQGFGDPEREYWLGLRHIYSLTQAKPTALYVGVTDFNVGEKYAKYGTFKVSSEAEKFRLTVASYFGNAGDSLTYHNGEKFSTKDQDNDPYSGDCSNLAHGGWWYKDCYYANLNGRFSATKVTDFSYMTWYHIQNIWQSIKDSVMMVRPANFKP